MNNKLKRLPLAMGLAGVLAGYSMGAGAAGFALIEQSGSGMGNAFAGGAASAEDASTIFYNPAGLTRLSGRQLLLAMHAIQPSAKFSNTGSAAPAFQTLGGNGGDAGDLAFVPNFYYVMDINPQFKFGLGVNAPFGLKTEYDRGWAGQFQALKSEVKTLNINPSLAYRVNDTVSIGGGINYQRIKAELTNAQNFGATVGFTKITGDDSAWGYNLGALFQISPNTRVGVAYRSDIKFKLSGGNAEITTATGATFLNAPVTADIKTPDSLSVSVFHQMNPKWDIMADLSWTRWSVFRNLTIVRADTGAVLSNQPENWRDTYRLSVGANYHYSDQWTFRGGIAYDQSPVSDVNRTARIPDNDRTWLAAGAQYKISKNDALDFGYAHLFVSNSSINDPRGVAPGAAGNLVGNYDNHVDILSVQYNHAF